MRATAGYLGRAARHRMHAGNGAAHAIHAPGALRRGPFGAPRAGHGTAAETCIRNHSQALRLCRVREAVLRLAPVQAGTMGSRGLRLP